MDHRPQKSWLDQRDVLESKSVYYLHRRKEGFLPLAQGQEPPHGSRDQQVSGDRRGITEVDLKGEFPRPWIRSESRYERRNGHPHPGAPQPPKEIHEGPFRQPLRPRVVEKVLEVKKTSHLFIS